jgi:hypothetical protein
VSEQLSQSQKLKFAGGLALVWCIFCQPLWLLGIGFAGRFFLPLPAIDATDTFLLSLIFCLASYSLLACIAGLIWSAFRGRV